MNYDSGVFDQFKEPGRNYQIFEATTEGMNAAALYDVKQKDLMLCRELNPADWEKELKKNKRGFVIVANNQIFHRDITGYDPVKKIISCESRNKEKSGILQLKLEYTQIFEVEKVSG
ncbi:hypothetical protein V6B16_11455 [Salinimicrobium catena]|uniref:hypothetical protein n=1 Tax=Salinimicrobium catena TaxID=390640 RepID=UPI002FE4B82D